MVAGHVWENEATRLWLYSWHVPVFFVLSGYFWSRGRSVREDAGRRFQTLGRPYIFWLVVLLVFVAAWEVSTSSLSIGRAVSAVYGGQMATRPFSAFWFVTVLFFACLLLRSLERFPAWATWAVAGTGLVAGYMGGDLLARTPLSMGSAWPCMAFVLAGAAFRQVEPRLRWPGVSGLGLLGLSVVALVGVPGMGSVDIKNGEYGVPGLGVLVAVMVSAGLLLVLKAVFTFLPRTIHAVSTELAKAGFAVVLCHALVLLVLGTTAAGGVFDFVAATVLPWAVGLAALRTRASAWVTGVERQPRATSDAGRGVAA